MRTPTWIALCAAAGLLALVLMAAGRTSSGAIEYSMTVSGDASTNNFSGAASKLFYLLSPSGAATAADLVVIQKTSADATTFRILLNQAAATSNGHADFALINQGDFYVSPGYVTKVAIYADAAATYGEDFIISAWR